MELGRQAGHGRRREKTTNDAGVTEGLMPEIGVDEVRPRPTAGQPEAELTDNVEKERQFIPDGRDIRPLDRRYENTAVARAEVIHHVAGLEPG